MQHNEDLIVTLLKDAGITVNGTNDCDIQVHNNSFFSRLFRERSLGLGESYMDGWWDCPRLDKLFYRLLNAHLDQTPHCLFLNYKHLWPSLLRNLLTNSKHFLLNFQNRKRALEVGKHHYDLGHDLFESMLDRDLNYTCGYWNNAATLEESQHAKLQLVCEKLHLKQGQTILDIGCGWGSFARFAAKNYGVSVVGITISRRQKELADKLCQGLPIEIRLQDYRDIKGKFNHIVSLGMFEHVGYKNYRDYMTIAHQSLEDDGLFLLHTIGTNISTYASNPWIQKYIFPNGMLPSISQIGLAIEKVFIMEDWHNFSAYYDNTLMAWYENFNQHWNELKNRYDDRFYRMWRYYLLSCAGAFRSRDIQLWQIVLSKHGIPGGYVSVR